MLAINTKGNVQIIFANKFKIKYFFQAKFAPTC